MVRGILVFVLVVQAWGKKVFFLRTLGHCGKSLRSKR